LSDFVLIFVPLAQETLSARPQDPQDLGLGNSPWSVAESDHQIREIVGQMDARIAALLDVDSAIQPPRRFGGATCSGDVFCVAKLHVDRDLAGSRQRDGVTRLAISQDGANTSR
jgi:hypothetical protein